MPEAKFNYAAITTYYKLHMALDKHQHEFTYKKAQSLMKLADRLVKEAIKD